MHVLPSPFPWTSVCTLRISFSSPRPLTWNDSLFLSSFRGWHTAESACVCLWGFTSVLRSHAALELSRESTNIQMLIKQKKKRLGPGVCGCAADRRTHPRSAPSQSHIYHLSRSRRALEPHGPAWDTQSKHTSSLLHVLDRWSPHEAPSEDSLLL